MLALAAIAVLSAIGNASAQDTNSPPQVDREYQAPAALDDREIWNRGVDAYNAGDWTNALATLQPLMLSRTHGARASEVVGAILHGRMKAAAAEDPIAAAKDAEESAAAMQITLRSTPDDPRANRNFTRAADRVAELRETAHVAKVLKEFQGRQPDQLLGSAVAEARSIMAAQKGVLTNEAAVALSGSEALARRAEKLADTWIPVKQAIIQSVTNEQQAAAIVGDVESARDATTRAAELLADMDPSADAPIATAENAFHRFRKMTVMPPDAIAEDILSQTNAYSDAEKINARPWQPEALDFTRVFRAKFPVWAQQYEQQAQADTNKPPFTKEQQEEVAKLAEEVEQQQTECVKAEDPPAQLDILRKLERIRELLPKDGKGGGDGQNNQQQQNQDQNQQQQQDKQDDKQDDKQQNAQDQQQDQQQDEKQEEKPKEENAQDKQEPKDDKEIEDLLRKAQERSDEHEADKRERARQAPSSANERDW